MIFRVLGLGVPVALGGLWVSGGMAGAPEGQTFQVPAAQVFSRLSTMSIPSEMRQGTDGHVSIETVPERTVAWRMTAKGYEALRVTATITPISDGETSVSTEIRFTETGPDAADGKRLNEMNGIKTIGGILMDEQIASTVEGRAFDQERIRNKVTAYALMHRSELKSELAEVQTMMGKKGGFGSSGGFGSGYASNFDDGESESVRAQSRASRPTFDKNRPMSSTRPMVDVSGSDYGN